MITLLYRILSVFWYVTHFPSLLTTGHDYNDDNNINLNWNLKHDMSSHMQFEADIFHIH